MRPFYLVVIILLGVSACQTSRKKVVSPTPTTPGDASESIVVTNTLSEDSAYRDSTIKDPGYKVSRLRLFNTSAKLGSREEYLNIFVPQDTSAFGKVRSYDYREAALKPFVHMTSTTGNGITIQNSLPKGGPYTSPSGQKFGCAVFWTRVINDSDAPLEVMISFPAAIAPFTDSYLKVFLPPDTMTYTKAMLFDYGLSDLKSFLDTNINQPTMFQKTIDAGEEWMFYVGALFNNSYSSIRGGFVLNDQQLFYQIKGIDPHLDAALIPCGQLVKHGR